MKKAFLFDMDGVLADTETMWDKLGYDDLLIDFFGQELFEKVPVKSGMSFRGIFDTFVAAGWQGEYKPFHDRNIEMGNSIYPSIPLSPGVDELIKYLSDDGFTIGIVSSSPIEWVNQLVSRFKSYDLIKYFLSVNNHKTLKPKPSPDPYLHAMKELAVNPHRTIILEDSATGVAAAKASGATTICYTAYNRGFSWQIMPENADYYAKNMGDVMDIVAKIDLQ